jgi:hypothetical protein
LSSESSRRIVAARHGSLRFALAASCFNRDGQDFQDSAGQRLPLILSILFINVAPDANIHCEGWMKHCLLPVDWQTGTGKQCFWE